MIRFRRLRLFLKWCLAGLIGVVVLLLCCDWWLPSVLPRLLSPWGVQVASVSRVESGRWELDGLVTVAPDRADGFDLRFDLNGTDLGYGDYKADGVRLGGEVQGSVITLDRLELDILDETEADRVSITGVADWAERTMDLKYEAALGADWLNAFLREQYFVDALRSRGRVFGRFDHPELEGMLEPVTLSHPLLHPVTLAGAMVAIPLAFNTALQIMCP